MAEGHPMVRHHHHVHKLVHAGLVQPVLQMRHCRVKLEQYNLKMKETEPEIAILVLR